MAALDRDALVRVLTEPRNALVRQYQKLFELDGVELEFELDALEAMADLAVLRGTGARGLRAIMEEVLMSIMYDVPSREVRGEHAHKACHQFLVCVKGSLSVVLDDGQHRDEVPVHDVDGVDLGLACRRWTVTRAWARILVGVGDE